MRIRHLLVAMFAVLLVLPLATAAMAQEFAQQTIEVSVMAENVRAIWVDGDFGLGAVTQGQSTNNVYFGMALQNTYSGMGFEVVVDGDDLVSFTSGEPCDENGCPRVPDGQYTIPKSNLYVMGGTLGWDPDPVTAFGGNLSDTAPLLIMSATADAYGGFDVANQPYLRLDVPGTADLANYYTTLTYTIQAPTP